MAIVWPDLERLDDGKSQGVSAGPTGREDRVGDIVVPEAAAMLGVSTRTVYDLAAPGGPIPCYRIGRTLSFDPGDLEAYLQSCRHEPLPKPMVKLGQPWQRLKVSDPLGESDLVKLFRSHGITPKKKP